MCTGQIIIQRLVKLNPYLLHPPYSSNTARRRPSCRITKAEKKLPNDIV